MLPAGQFVETSRDILRRNRRARAAEHPVRLPPHRRPVPRPAAAPPGPPAAAASPAAPAADRHTFHGQFERRAGAHGFDLDRCLPSSSRRRPASRPSTAAGGYPARWRRPGPGRLHSAGELLHAVAEIEQAEVAGADHAAAGADEQLAAALDHVDAHRGRGRDRSLSSRGPRECCSRSRRRDSNCRAWPAGNTSHRDRS